MSTRCRDPTGQSEFFVRVREGGREGGREGEGGGREGGREGRRDCIKINRNMIQ